MFQSPSRSQSTVHTPNSPLPHIFFLNKKMAISLSTLLSFTLPPRPLSLLRSQQPKISHFPTHLPNPFKPLPFFSNSNPEKTKNMLTTPSASGSDLSLIQNAIQLIQSSPPTWLSSLVSNLIIFVLGTPILISGLSLSGIVAAFMLGTLTWRSFGPPGFLLVAAYFVIGTAATKVKMAQKEAQGVAEKRKGRRGPGSVIGSSAAGCVFAVLSISGIGGKAYSPLWMLGFIASFCTKLSDTVSSEIGKAYGRTTYLVTTFKVVPRGTEGAVSVEGTLAGLLASILLASVGRLLGEINVPEAIICVVASQIANLGESFIGAEFQGKEGFHWLNNDAVNIINITIGSILAVVMQQIILQKWHL